MTTRDGRKLRVVDMTDEHLYNAIRHIEARCARFAGEYEPPVENSAEEAVGEYIIEPEDYAPKVLAVMRAVATARGIQL